MEGKKGEQLKHHPRNIMQAETAKMVGFCLLFAGELHAEIRLAHFKRMLTMLTEVNLTLSLFEGITVQ